MGVVAVTDIKLDLRRRGFIGEVCMSCMRYICLHFQYLMERIYDLKIIF
jgi:hypothetical protein